MAEQQTAFDPEPAMEPATYRLELHQTRAIKVHAKSHVQTKSEVLREIIDAWMRRDVQP